MDHRQLGPVPVWSGSWWTRLRVLIRAWTGIILLWLDLSALYQLMLALLAAASARRATPPREGQLLDTAILVPAHDEERVIQSCLRSLVNQRPALSADRIIVVADNCTDRTAELARAEGVTVWSREDPTRRGKGHALAWAFERLSRELPQVDVIGVVDADCVALPGLWAGWSGAFASGAAAVQADYRISNADESAAAARRWAGFALRHRIRGLAKERMGLSCGLYGTGMAFSRETLAAHPWDSFSLTEDAEFHARIVTGGNRVVFVAHTAVESPAPISEREAQIQQNRWESGNLTLARRTVPGLVRSGIAQRDPVRLHLAWDQLVPPQSILVAGLTALALVRRVVNRRTVPAAASVGAAAEAGYVIIGLVTARAPSAVWKSLLTAPILITRKITQYARIILGGGSQEWVRTTRR